MVTENWMDDESGVTIPEALEMEFVLGSGRRRKIITLGELAKRNPGYLDQLLDTSQPGTRIFEALVLLCDHFQNDIAFRGEKAPKLKAHKLREPTKRDYDRRKNQRRRRRLRRLRGRRTIKRVRLLAGAAN